MLVKIRADSKYRLGIQGFNDNSPYMHVDRSGFGLSYSPNSSTEDTKSKDDVLVSINYISLAAACKIMILSLTNEFGKA